MSSAPIDPDKLINRILQAIQYRMNWTRQQAVTMLGAVIVAGVILFCGLSLAVSTAVGQPAPTPTTVPLAVHTVADVMTYLKTVGATVSGAKSLPVPNPTWQAVQGQLVKVQLDKNSGTVTLLSYSSVDASGVDMFRATNSGTYKGWNLIQFANVLLVAPPDVSADLVNTLVSHLTTYLISPYRTFMPTATAKQ